MTAHEVLIAAKGYLLNNGWTRHSYGHGIGGPRCLVGVLVEVTGGWPDSCRMEEIAPDATKALCDAIGCAPWHQGFVIGFNDESGRTFDDVVAFLDKAILATVPKACDSCHGDGEVEVNQTNDPQCAEPARCEVCEGAGVA